MSKPRITITLEREERSALMQLAGRELREPRDQARYILRNELQRLGLICADPTDPTQIGGIEPCSN
jgi:hypothetical protein